MHCIVASKFKYIFFNLKILRHDIIQKNSGNDFNTDGRRFVLLFGSLNWSSITAGWWHMQAILKLKKIVVLKLSIKYKFWLHNCISFEETFKARPHLNIFRQYFSKHINCFMYNEKYQNQLVKMLNRSAKVIYYWSCDQHSPI